MREKHGLGAVVINHDLIKDYFVDPSVREILSGSSVGKEEGKGTEKGISFNDAAKLSYKLDWILVWDMFDQGQDVVILDSVCNYREAVENGLALVERWNSVSTNSTGTADVSGTGCSGAGRVAGGGMEGYENGKGDMVYVYVECQFGDGDLEALDKRLKERAERGGVLRSQRTGVFERPAGDVGCIGDGPSKMEKDKEAGELFRKWMDPARPREEDGAIVVIVDSRRMSAEEGVMDILGKLPFGLSG